MSNPTSNFGWQMPTNSDLVTDLPADFEVFGQAVDTSLADLKGGTTGQVLSKATNADMDFIWVAQDDSNAIQNAIVDAKGDLIAASAADTPARLAVGTNGQVLVADSTAATGLKWQTMGSAAVLQIVVGSTNTSMDTSSATYADTNLTATITPSSASSRILVMFNQNGLNRDNSSYQTYGNLRLLRGATTLISIIDRNIGQSNNTQQLNVGGVSHAYIDSPATTSAITYKTQAANPSTAGVFTCQYAGAYSEMILMEIV